MVELELVGQLSHTVPDAIIGRLMEDRIAVSYHGNDGAQAMLKYVIQPRRTWTCRVSTDRGDTHQK